MSQLTTSKLLAPRHKRVAKPNRYGWILLKCLFLRDRKSFVCIRTVSFSYVNCYADPNATEASLSSPFNSQASLPTRYSNLPRGCVGPAVSITSPGPEVSY